MSSKAKQAAQNAVKTPSSKREPIPLQLSEQMAHEFLRQRKLQLQEEEAMLLTDIIKNHGLDPEQIGKEYLITPNAIVFEVK